ncbi:MAG: type II toxin-antitoxin system RelE/ParE family toxin [Clostridia bacterium]|nr:type II toxin-antitoxin system RelE/ParE family toxin [Clostridia bacterium]
MHREFVTLPSFEYKWKSLDLNDEDKRRLEQALLDNPKIGPVMRGTGKVRKMRFAFENRGKSGSMRVIYVDFEVYEKIYFVDVYTKAEKDNLSMAERNDLKQLVELLELELEIRSSGKE